MKGKKLSPSLVFEYNNARVKVMAAQAELFEQMTRLLLNRMEIHTLMSLYDRGEELLKQMNESVE